MHSIGHLMRKQKNYLKDHLQKFASRAHHQLRHHVGVTPTSDSQNSLSTSELPNTKALINSSYSETSISVAVKENDEYKRPRQRHRNENDNSKARKGAVKWKFDINEQKKIHAYLMKTKKRPSPILTAYIEDSTSTPRSSDNHTYPLPLRTQAPPSLKKFEYPLVEKCSGMPETLPVNHPIDLNSVYKNVNNHSPMVDRKFEYAKYCPVDADPFLPWIHDVFPNRDIFTHASQRSTHIEFVAQNKRRCNTQLPMFKNDLSNLEPQVALMQPVSVKRISNHEAQKAAPKLWIRDKNEQEPFLFDIRGETSRYKLTDYENADEDGQQTRFVCRFHAFQLVGDEIQNVILGESLSVYPYNYEFANWRKTPFEMLPDGGKGSNGCFWNSVQHFRCPIPKYLQELVGSGETVVDDIASIYVDVVPIRTRSRKGLGDEYFNEQMVGKSSLLQSTFNPRHEWGENHVLPEIDASGRWENIPICVPPLPDLAPSEVTTTDTVENQIEPLFESNILIGCTWASAQFTTRGDAKSDASTSSRLLEWLTFHLDVVGMDHIYVYDNSGAHTSEISLKEITDMFPPSRVTRVVWPFRVCNNNIPAHANTGERSSQYAAEASCRLRYGPYTRWLASFDTDEYFCPMGKWGDLRSWLTEGVNSDTNILGFRSTKAMIDYDYTEPYWDGDAKSCGTNATTARCVIQRPDALFLETYNCDLSLPKPDWSQRAKKQIYRPSYVLNHYVHYSTVTNKTVVYYEDAVKEIGGGSISWYRGFYSESSPSERFVDEQEEAVMMHTKSTLPEETNEFKERCHYTHWPKNEWDKCRVGFSHPLDFREGSGQPWRSSDGFNYTCWKNERLETIFLPKLRKELAKYQVPNKKKATNF